MNEYLSHPALVVVAATAAAAVTILAGSLIVLAVGLWMSSDED